MISSTVYKKVPSWNTRTYDYLYKLDYELNNPMIEVSIDGETLDSF
jgi:hypothetical protein